MDIIVETTSDTATTGTLVMDGKRYACTLGRSGVIAPADKAEGDGKTPLGTYPLRQLLYRADRLPAPETGLPVEELTPDTGWCEDPAHDDYNTKVTLPHGAKDVDHMSREDYVYDLVVPLGYNDDPPVKGKGSAIFMHVARHERTPTAGCVGLALEDLVEVLKKCDATTRLTVLPPPHA